MGDFTAANWGAFAIILAIVIVAGGIAFIGDRVGHQVGRRRMTLFGLRPKYTSTIFAVGFGMLIALGVIVIALISSYDARQALFSLNKLNEQINTLTIERDNLIQDPVVWSAGQPLTQPVIVSSRVSDEEIERVLSLLFVDVANLYRSEPGVRPYPKNPLSQGVMASIEQAAKGIKTLDPTSAIVVPVAGHNIFRGTAMSISFEVFKDTLIYRKGEQMGSVVVGDGRNADLDQAALFRLGTIVKQNAQDHGMPSMISDNLATTEDESSASLRELTSISSPAVITAVAPADIYAEGPLEAKIVVSPVAR
jgi:uncharacterized protein (DUF3084 family)